jgi:5-methylcytosine-specific restriction enzyme A
MADFILTGRAVEEWIGKTPDSRPPKSVVDRLFLKQMGRCAISGRKFAAKEIAHTDHIVPLKDGGQNREKNMQLIAVEAHREKTRAENSARAKERRQRLKHAGLWPKSARPIQSRGFPKRSPTLIGDSDG